ncbi:MAG: LysM peptidoglycan-binding domain-containing protein [Ancrocorticia sp.]
MENKRIWRSLLVASCAAIATIFSAIMGMQSAHVLSETGSLFATASTESLTHAVMLACAAIGVVAGLWVFFSYVALLRAHRTGRDGLLVRLALRFATPAVRRSLAGLAVSSALIAAPAAADPGFLATGPDLGWSPTSSQVETPPDLGAGSEAGSANIPVDDGAASPVFDGANSSSPPVVDAPQSDSNPSQPDVDSQNHEQYTVIPGDTLWSIAAGHLPSDASAADISVAADAWFLENSDQISHPHAIYPGQVFTSPRTSS